MKTSFDNTQPSKQTDRHPDINHLYYKLCWLQSALELKYSLKGATGGEFLASKCIKTIFGWGSAPDPTAGAYDARGSPVGWGGKYLLPIP